MYGIDRILLRQTMIAKGYNTGVALAKAIGCSKDTVNNVLNGKTKPQASIMYAIARALELSEEDAGRIFFAKHLA